MLSVMCSFLYMGATAFLMGFAVKKGTERFLCFSMRGGVSVLIAGLAAATIYAGIWSLFGGVGLGANVGLLFLCLLSAVWAGKEIRAFLRERKRRLTWRKLLFLAILILVMAYGTSRGYLHFDTGLYHAQSIRWIEEYGVAPGLANLHSRLGYNSSAFCLTALYSMAFLTGRSLHTAAGFLALLLAVKGFSVAGIMSRKRALPSDVLKIALLWYLSVIYTEMMSPSTDYFAILLLFFILISWVELEEKKEESLTPYSLLCVLLVVTVTIKLSAAAMLLLAIRPALGLFRAKQYGRIGAYLLLGLLAAFPYLARNVILTGWLVYPFGGLDFFSVDWKLPLGELLYDAEEIRAYAKGIRDVALKDMPFGDWLPSWFAELKGLEKLLALSSALSVPLGALWCLRAIVKREKPGLVFVEAALMAGYLFWQTGAPLVRYGYFYILALPFLTFGLWYVTVMANRRAAYGLLAAFLAVFGLYKGKNLVQDMLRHAGQDAWLWQQDYVTGAYDSYELEGITIYVPLESGQIGYAAFPSSPYERDDLTLRDGTLKGGFMRVSPPAG